MTSIFSSSKLESPADNKTYSDSNSSSQDRKDTSGDSNDSDEESFDDEESGFADSLSTSFNPNTASSSHGGKDGAIALKETKLVNCSKMTVIMVVSLLACITGLFTFFYVGNLEHTNYVTSVRTRVKLSCLPAGNQPLDLSILML